MSKILLRERLPAGVCLGAGTCLDERCDEACSPCDMMTMHTPASVRARCEAQMEAGCTVVATPPCGAWWPCKSSPKCDPDAACRSARLLRELCREAARAARRVANSRHGTVVAGCIGPIRMMDENSCDESCPPSAEESRASFEAQVCGLVEGGVDFIHLVHVTSAMQLHCALQVCMACAPTTPIVVSVECCDCVATPESLHGFCDILRCCRDAGVAGVGVCGTTTATQTVEVARLVCRTFGDPAAMLFVEAPHRGPAGHERFGNEKCSEFVSDLLACGAPTCVIGVVGCGPELRDQLMSAITTHAECAGESHARSAKPVVSAIA